MDDDEGDGSEIEDDSADEEDPEADTDGADEDEGEAPDLPDPRQAGTREPADRRGVPPARLREEADARRVAEAEARELRARLDAVEARQRQPQPRADQQQPPEAPDMFADPEGFKKDLRDGIIREFNERRINDSMADAEETHGDQFREAFQGLQRSGNPALVSQILNSRNPGKSLMDWHGRQALMADIGSDPNAWLERKLQERLADPEVRRAVITGARNDAMRGDGGRPRTQTRLPPSLNGATGGTSHRGDTAPRGRGGGARSTRSEEREIFESAFED
jgi:hypothetical protein